MSTESILEALHAMEEAPWADLRGRPFDARGLARMLSQYDIKSKQVWVEDHNRRGYAREDLWDAWARYVNPPGSPPETTLEALEALKGPSNAANQTPQPSLLADLAPAPEANLDQPCFVCSTVHDYSTPCAPPDAT
jgi:hypothetical protein